MQKVRLPNYSSLSLTTKAYSHLFSFQKLLPKRGMMHELDKFIATSPRQHTAWDEVIGSTCPGFYGFIFGTFQRPSNVHLSHYLEAHSPLFWQIHNLGYIEGERDHRNLVWALYAHFSTAWSSFSQQFRPTENLQHIIDCNESCLAD